jgi:hypothetical protein
VAGKEECTPNPHQACPPWLHLYEQEIVVIMIGIDPHKGSHTAVALDSHECVLAELKVCADRHQTERLLAWAAPFANTYVGD